MTAMPHGTWDGYINHGCRCEECRAASAEYKREWRRKHPGLQARRKQHELARDRALRRLGRMFPEQLAILIADELQSAAAALKEDQQ